MSDMTPDHASAWEVICLWMGQHWKWFAAWVGTIGAAQLQAWVGVASGLALFVYTVVRTYFLVRNKGERSE